MVLTEQMKTMMQLTLAKTGFLPKVWKQTWKAAFLAEMETVVPWSRLEAPIEPFYPKKESSRRVKPLGMMLRIHFMQQWFGYSYPAVEKALYDISLLRQFARLDVFKDVMPNESNVLRFRHLLEQHSLATAILAEVAGVLSEKGLVMKRGTLVDVRLIAAPSSTKDKDKQRDPEMTQTQKGKQWHFGMKVHIDVDAESGLIHTVERKTAKVADITMMDGCLHGEETITFGDRGYHKANRRIEPFEKEGHLSLIAPTKRPVGGKLTDEQKVINRMLSVVKAFVEHPFRVIKRQFRFTETPYRRLKMETVQIVTLFARANLWLPPKRLVFPVGEVHL